jgi:hypothetical protein
MDNGRVTLKKIRTGKARDKRRAQFKQIRTDY